MPGNTIPLCKQHGSTNNEATQANREQYSGLSSSVHDLAGSLAGMIGSLGLEGQAAGSADQVLEGLSARLHFQATEIEKLADACEKATVGAQDTKTPADLQATRWELANEQRRRLEALTATVPPEKLADHERKIAEQVEIQKDAEAEGGRIISQLDVNTSDAISLLPDFLPPSSQAPAAPGDSGVNGAGVGASATASSTLASGSYSGATGGAQATSATSELSAGAGSGMARFGGTSEPTQLSAGQGGSITGRVGSGSEVDPTLLSATSRAIGSDVASEFAAQSMGESASSGASEFAPSLAQDSNATGATVSLSATGKASQLGAIVSPALMAAGLPKILKATQMTGNLLSLRGATGGSSPISAQGSVGRASLSPTSGSGATTMGARPATAGAGGRGGNLAARARTTGARAGSLSSHGGTTAPRAAAASARSSTQGSRTLSPRTPAQGASGRPVGQAGAQGARGAAGQGTATRASSQAPARGGAMGRAQKALGLGRGAGGKNEKDKTAREPMSERQLETDSRLNFLGRGRRESDPDSPDQDQS